MIKTLNTILRQDKEKSVRPKGVQDIIPIKAIYEDGIFLVGKDKYSKTYRFDDIKLCCSIKRRSKCDVPAVL